MIPRKKKSSEQPIIIVKRPRKVADDKPHGTWKIAYADFMTAMMAFFLLMWLLGSTTRGDLKGVSDYFKMPMTVALMGGTGSGTATSIIQGGGKDLTRADAGEVKKSIVEAEKNDPLKPRLSAQQREEDRLRLEGLRNRVRSFIEQAPYLQAFRNQIRLDITHEGLLIQLIDEQNRPMFDSGRAQLKDYSRALLRSIGPMLNEVENRVSVAGHTDSKPYSGGETGYSNWELSSERANAARRELIYGGLQDRKVLQVRGLADAQPLFEDEPLHPGNRRITVLVLNKESEQSFYLEGKAKPPITVQ